MRFPLSLTPTIHRQADTGAGADPGTESDGEGGGGHYNPDQPRDWHGRWTAGGDQTGDGGDGSGQSGRGNLLEMAGSGSNPSSPDPWQVRNMADALSRTSDYSGTALHYQMQAESDPEGTSAEVKAVAAEMAKTDPDSADRFLGQMREAGVVEGGAALPRGIQYAQANTGTMTDAGPAISPPAFDRNKFGDTLNQNAGEKPGNKCATRVRESLEAGGLDVTGHPRDAKDWGPTLEKNGFTPVDEKSYRPEKGDVVVIQPYPGGNESGHIAAYDGKQWISDFKQRDMWGGQGYRTQQPPHVVYRRGN